MAQKKRRNDLHEDFKLTVSDVCLLGGDKAICILLATAIILKIFFVSFIIFLLVRFIDCRQIFFPLLLALCSARLVVVVFDYFYVTMNFSVFAMQSRKIQRRRRGFYDAL